MDWKDLIIICKSAELEWLEGLGVDRGVILDCDILGWVAGLDHLEKLRWMQKLGITLSDCQDAQVSFIAVMLNCPNTLDWFEKMGSA